MQKWQRVCAIRLFIHKRFTMFILTCTIALELIRPSQYGYYISILTSNTIDGRSLIFMLVVSCVCCCCRRLLSTTFFDSLTENVITKWSMNGTTKTDGPLTNTARNFRISLENYLPSFSNLFCFLSIAFNPNFSGHRKRPEWIAKFLNQQTNNGKKIPIYLKTVLIRSWCGGKRKKNPNGSCSYHFNSTEKKIPLKLYQRSAHANALPQFCIHTLGKRKKWERERAIKRKR